MFDPHEILADAQSSPVVPTDENGNRINGSFPLAVASAPLGPIDSLASVAIDGTTPASLFTSRTDVSTGWRCANNTGQAVWFLEVKSGDTPSAADVKAAGVRVLPGGYVEGNLRTADIYAILDAGTSGDLYPQEVA